MKSLICLCAIFGLTACHAQQPTSSTLTGPTGAPASPATAAFAKNAPLVKSAQVIVAAPANDPLDASLTSLGGFAATVNVSHAQRTVPHSFAVGYSDSGTPVEAIYLNDSGETQVTTDPDLLALYASKAHKLVSSAPSPSDEKTASSDHSGPFGTSSGGGSSSESSGHHSATVHGKGIEPGMTKAEVKRKIGPPDDVFGAGTDHERWEVKPFDPIHDVGTSVITSVASGFGIFGGAASNAGMKFNKKQKTYMINFDGDVVSSVYTEDDRN